MVARFRAPTALQTASALGMSLRTHAPKINEIIRDCNTKQDGYIQALEEIITLCIENGFVDKKNIKARKLGIHPESCATSTVTAVAAQNLALRISREGFSVSKLTVSMCFEKAESGTPAASAQREFMQRNYELSEGYLHNLLFQDADYLAVTGRHLIAALHIMSVATHEDLLTDGFGDGWICCAELYEISCLVFRKELEAACPELPGFLSKAGNQSQANGTKVQLTLSMAQKLRYGTAVSAHPAAREPVSYTHLTLPTILRV